MVVIFGIRDSESKWTTGHPYADNSGSLLQSGFMKISKYGFNYVMCCGVTHVLPTLILTMMQTFPTIQKDHQQFVE